MSYLDDKLITIEELEKKRKFLRKIYTISSISGLAIILTLFIIITPDNATYEQILYNTFMITLITSVIIGLIFSTIIGDKAKEYRLNYKNYFVKTALSKIFTNLQYYPERGLNETIIASTNMINMGDRYTSNDLITGDYKDVSFKQADVHIEEEHGSDDKSYETKFKGRWIVFDFNKQFKSNVQVCQKGFGSNITNTLFSKTKYTKIEMESADFNNYFDVYAINPHDAFYILTPTVMEKIRKLDKINIGELLLCFVDNKLHVGIYDYTDSFEHDSVFHKINETEILERIEGEISKITMFVDELDLDNELFNNDTYNTYF